MNDDGLEAIGVSTPEARELVQSLMAVIEILTDTHEKGTSKANTCLEQFHSRLRSCNMYDYEDPRTYKECLDTARKEYDFCREHS